MKYIPITTLLLWTSLIIGYLFAKGFVLQPIIQFPAVILLSIFLPVCFWDLVSRNRRGYAFIFLAIFICNTVLLSYVAFSTYSFLKSFDPYRATKIDPELAELLVSGKDEETRNATAQVIFEKYGISLPFLIADRNFEIYTPTQGNKHLFLKNSQKNARSFFVKYRTIYQIDSLLFLLAIHVSIFIGLLSFMILRERPSHVTLKTIKHA